MANRTTRASVLDLISAKGIAETDAERKHRLINFAISIFFAVVTLYITLGPDFGKSFTDMSAMNVPVILAITALAKTIISFCPWRLVRPILSIALAIAACLTLRWSLSEVPIINPQPTVVWVSTAAMVASAIYDCWVYRRKARFARAAAQHRLPKAPTS